MDRLIARLRGWLKRDRSTDLAPVTLRGPGILVVDPAQLIQTPEARRQLEALRRLRETGLHDFDSVR